MESRNRPFIVFGSQKNRSLIPPESPSFDEGIEAKVRFAQGADAFVIFFLMYETLRASYLHFTYKNECDDYSGFMLGMALMNAFWIGVSIQGLRSINSKQSFRIKQNLFMLVSVLLSRIIFYSIMISTMNNVVYDPVTSCHCDAIYQGGLVITTLILEAGLLITIISLTNIVKNYVENYEMSQYAPMEEY